MKYPEYYCKKCGALCRGTIKPRKGYNSKTGKKLRPDYQLKCPNLKFFSSGGHFNETVTEDVEGNWFYGAGNEFGPFYIYVKPEEVK